jgi:RNA polymerase sigma-70 factor (ECF subfamily)
MNNFTSSGPSAGDSRHDDVGFEDKEFGEWTDAELVHAMGQRNEGALMEAYNRHGISVYSTVFRMCAPEAAENVTHKVFLDLWDTPDAFDPLRGSMSSYLVAAAHRRAVRLLRDEATRRVHAAPAPSAHYHRGSEALALSGDYGVRTLLAELSEFQQHAVLLAYFGGYTYQEIAERLGQSESFVKANLRDGLFKLRPKSR